MTAREQRKAESQRQARNEGAKRRRLGDLVTPSAHAAIPQQEVPSTDILLPSDRGGLPTERSPKNNAPKLPGRAEQGQIRAAKASREAWEASPVGQARTRNAQDLLGTKASVGQIYAANGWTQQTGTGPKHYDVQLPGMGDPMQAPRPARWEELSQETRMHAERAMHKHGTSIDQMSSDFGAQLDQAYVRASRKGADLPYATDFYSTGEAAEVIKGSAKDLGVPLRVHTMMNAITSPNTKFTQDTKDGRQYPNNETASYVVRHVQQGHSPYHVPMTEVDYETGEKIKTHQGRGANFARAGSALAQWAKGGKTPSEWRNKPSKSSPQGSGMIGQKTGPYANSFSSDPQFFVSDVHSGGGGMLPHLGTNKPTRTSADGTESPGKSERELGISRITHFHAAADYAARQAIQQRGLGSLRDAQASQWGEEQIQRAMKGGPTEDSAYPKDNTEMEGQGHLFPEMHLPKAKKKEIEGQGSLFG